MTNPQFTKYETPLLALFLWIFLPSGKTQDNYLIGYQNEVSGNKFTYHSPFSNAERAYFQEPTKTLNL